MIDFYFMESEKKVLYGFYIFIVVFQNQHSRIFTSSLGYRIILQRLLNIVLAYLLFDCDKISNEQSYPICKLFLAVALLVCIFYFNIFIVF